MEENYKRINRRLVNIKSLSKYKNKLDYKHSNPNFHDCSLPCAELHSKVAPFKLNTPFPVCYSLQQRYAIDPFLSVIHLKQGYHMKIERMKSGYRVNYRKRSSKSNKTFRKLQTVLDEEPDIYFNSNYNWYYTGGNMHIEHVSKGIRIFHSSNLTNLNVINLKQKKSKWYVKKKNFLNNNSNIIYQIESARHNSDTIVGIRNKNQVTLYKIEENENRNVACHSINNIDSNIPFVNINLDGMNVNEYVTVDAAKNISVWDSTTNKKIMKLRIPHHTNLKGNCFAQTAYFDNNVVGFVNKSGFSVLDKRNGDITNISMLLKESDTEYWRCEDDLSGLCLGRTDTINCYLSTVSKIKHVDIRAKRVLNTWTHEFQSTPFLSDYVRCNDIDALCISSRYPDEKLVLAHNNNINYLPNSYPTLTNAYESNCLASHSHADVPILTQEHLAANTTGINVVSTSKDAFTLFTTNSLGDVFGYTVNGSQDNINFNVRSPNHHVSEPLYVVDKVILNRLNLDINSEPIQTSNTNKIEIQKCLQHLKFKNFKAGNHISGIWYDEDGEEKIVLKGLDEITSSANIEHWFSNMPNKHYKNE